MAFGIDDAVAAGAKLLDDAINKIWPDPESKARAEAVAITAATQAAVQTIQAKSAVFIAEAQSQDKWTSRARPSFLYVMYAMILASIPMGILWAFEPAYAERIATGMKMWLSAIPDMLWEVFGWSFGAYALARTGEKIAPAMKGKKGP